MPKREGNVKQVKLPDGRVRLDYDDPVTGKRCRPIMKNQTFADIEARKVLRSMEEHTDPRSHRMRFGEMSALYLADYSGTRSVPANLRNHVLPYWDSWIAARITPPDVQKWIDTAVNDGTRSAYTVDNIYNTFRNVVVWAMKKRLLVVHPCQGIKRPERRPRTVPPDAVAQFRLIVSAMPGRFRLAPILALALGARIMEVLALRLGKIDFDAQQIHVDDQLVTGGFYIPPTFGPTKGRDQRTLDVHVEVLTMVMEHLDEFYVENEHGLLLVDEGGWSWGYDRVSNAWTEAWADVEATSMRRFHDIRHLASSVEKAAGVNEVDIMHRRGHKQLATTHKYLHSLTPRSETAAAALAIALRPGPTFARSGD